MRDRALRAISECWKIAAMSEEPHRITRRFLTAAVHDVHAHMRARMEAHAMTVHVDAAGNLRGLWQPANASPSASSLARTSIPCPMPARSTAFWAWRSRSNGYLFRKSLICLWHSK